MCRFILVGLLILAGCGKPESCKVQEGKDPGWYRSHAVPEQDQQRREAFARLEKGMTEDRVIQVMGAKPDAVEKSIWKYKLSHAADTRDQIDYTYLVAFEQGKMTSKEVAYTDIVWLERK